VIRAAKSHTEIADHQERPIAQFGRAGRLGIQTDDALLLCFAVGTRPFRSDFEVHRTHVRRTPQLRTSDDRHARVGVLNLPRLGMPTDRRAQVPVAMPISSVSIGTGRIHSMKCLVTTCPAKRQRLRDR
jgi:hypothetical protein